MKSCLLLIPSLLLLLLYSCSPDETKLTSKQYKTPVFADSAVAGNFVLLIDHDSSAAPTPINQAYCDAINATAAGDEILSFQKYFKNKRLNEALIMAADRNVQVRGIYRDELDPPCSSLNPAARTICDEIFIQSPHPHHKNMMILKSDGTVNAFIGSYNLRERTLSEPRIHTVLAFDIVNGRRVFDFYRGEEDRLRDLPTKQPLAMRVNVEGGGTLLLQMHPGRANPVLDMVKAVDSIESTLWMSFYGAGVDDIATPVYDKLKVLNDAGNDVRVLFHSKNDDARNALEARGVPVRFPDYPVGSALLGHKLVMVRSAGDLHLIQSSANLNEHHYRKDHNLTLYLHAPGLHNIQAQLEAELNRYWK